MDYKLDSELCAGVPVESRPFGDYAGMDRLQVAYPLLRHPDIQPCALLFAGLAGLFQK